MLKEKNEMKALALLIIGMVVLASTAQSQGLTEEEKRPRFLTQRPSAGLILAWLSSLSTTPGRLSFGMTQIGDESTERVVIRNSTGDPAENMKVFTENRSSLPFSVDASLCPMVLRAKQSCTIKVTYKPSTAKRDRRRVMVSSSLGEVSIDLSGQGVSQ